MGMGSCKSLLLYYAEKIVWARSFYFKFISYLKDLELGQVKLI